MLPPESSGAGGDVALDWTLDRVTTAALAAAEAWRASMRREGFDARP
jgi:hypothetical protein